MRGSQWRRGIPRWRWGKDVPGSRWLEKGPPEWARANRVPAGPCALRAGYNAAQGSREASPRAEAPYLIVHDWRPPRPAPGPASLSLPPLSNAPPLSLSVGGRRRRSGPPARQPR